MRHQQYTSLQLKYNSATIYTWVLEVIWVHLFVHLSVIKCTIVVLPSLSEVYLEVYNLYTPPLPLGIKIIVVIKVGAH